jgi:hypothetical protein
VLPCHPSGPQLSVTVRVRSLAARSLCAATPPRYRPGSLWWCNRRESRLPVLGAIICSRRRPQSSDLSALRALSTSRLSAIRSPGTYRPCPRPSSSIPVRGTGHPCATDASSTHDDRLAQVSLDSLRLDALLPARWLRARASTLLPVPRPQHPGTITLLISTPQASRATSILRDPSDLLQSRVFRVVLAPPPSLPSSRPTAALAPGAPSGSWPVSHGVGRQSGTPAAGP